MSYLQVPAVIPSDEQSRAIELNNQRLFVISAAVMSRRKTIPRLPKAVVVVCNGKPANVKNLTFRNFMTTMEISSKAKNIITQISDKTTKLGDVRKIANGIKKDHELAMELWSTGQYLARQLAILIMDKKLLSQELIDKLDKDIKQHKEDERNQLIDWLMANQLSKDKKTISLMESWINSQSSLQRRIFWYYQGRLRWLGQTPPPNTEELLSLIETRIENEEPEVQWAMNFTTAQIGIFQEKYRSRCVTLGERTGLYKDEMVAKNCTPNYLPKYIAIQVAKLNK